MTLQKLFTKNNHNKNLERYLTNKNDFTRMTKSKSKNDSLI